MHFRILLFTGILLPLWACRQGKNTTPTTTSQAQTMQAVVEKVIPLDSIPSGSGLVKTDQQLYLVSDDSPYFFQLNLQYQTAQKIAIAQGEKTALYRIPKKLKPDYESLATGLINGQKHLLAFGSGTQSPERDSLLVIPIENLRQPQTYTLKPLYELIRTTANLPEAELNIEGSAIVGEDLFLFNRGQNVVIKTNWARLLLFLKGGPNIIAPKIQVYRIKLPQIKGITPGFSGACQLGKQNKILFTASVEDTPNWVQDGEILGSFVGILNLEKLDTDPLENAMLLTDKSGRPVIEKVESIEFITQEANGNLKALALTDDDQGGSKILEVALQKNE